MSRRHAAERREILPDPKFGDVVVNKFMNSLMLAGKKSIAEGILYGAFDRIESKTGNDPVKVFHEALENVKPSVEVRRDLSGAHRGAPDPSSGACHPLAHQRIARPQRANHDRAPRRRADGRRR